MPASGKIAYWWGKDGKFPEWVNLRFPETTLCVSVINPLITTEKIADEVAIAIQSVDAIPGKIYVAFITQHSRGMLSNGNFEGMYRAF